MREARDLERLDKPRNRRQALPGARSARLATAAQSLKDRRAVYIYIYVYIEYNIIIYLYIYIHISYYIYIYVYRRGFVVALRAQVLVGECWVPQPTATLRSM